MNFRRISLITVLAAAQVFAAVPAAAASPDLTAPAQSAGSTLQSTAVEQGEQSLQQQTDQQDVQPEQQSVEEQSVETDSIETDSAQQESADSIPDEAEGVSSSVDTEQDSKQSANQQQAEEEGNGSGETGNSSGNTGNDTNISSTSETSPASKNELVLLMNSDVMYHNGQRYKAGEPMAVKKGVSYIAVRAMVERAGLKLSFDNKTKETIIIKDGNELRFKTGSSNYKVNGQVRPMKGPAYISNNVFMVPLTSITQALDIPYTVNQSEKKVILDLSRSGSGDGGSSDGGSTQPEPGDGSGGSQVPNLPNLGPNDLILMMNSDVMYQGGKMYKAGQPMAVKRGYPTSRSDRWSIG